MKRKGGVLVTGGAVRIGAAIVERLAQDGYDIAIHCNRSGDEASELAQQIRTSHRAAACVVISDLAEPNLAHIVGEARAGLNCELTVLINSASVFERDCADDFDGAGFDLHMDVNLRAPLLLAQSFAAQAPHGSSIINLLDQRVLRSTPRYFTYTLSKSALQAATRTMAQAFAPKIRVNAVAPGLTLPNAHQDAQDYARRIATLPLQRGGCPAEIAAAVSFLIGSPSVTGQTLAIDGGQHLAWQTADVSAA
jgi:NAD(P)-dependent dehydrogenase (short-subunit alcohol dehydrogenase family)